MESMAPPPLSSTSATFDSRRDNIINLACTFIVLVFFFVGIYAFMYIEILVWLIDKETTKKKYFRLRDVELGRLPAGERIQDQSDGEENDLAKDQTAVDF
ncbi:unnamed protein product [Arabidopsis lyrata]|uniref:Predicted protein n=1 Tax=Arabidopsis lyrata subsp. lyrata TaxID=81972 RepID=D7LHJ8_ARALL|nr:predicted protein [Arabidopsis lyrata subsp. lyrata]CAH8263349.1 unnamed protein product [Arabidopsis lyrata]